MLKSKTSKIIIGTIIVLCVLAASSIWVFSSLKANSVDDFGYSQLAASGSATATKTQIDHIIENSNTAEEGVDPNYNVVIITNGVTDASEIVKNFFLDDEKGFSKVVVNDNRTISATMPNGKMRMTVKTVQELNGLDKDGIAAALTSADLIYLYAPTDTAYTGGSAISEDLYEYLHNYAFGSNKPLIMSYGLKNTGEGDDQQAGGEGTGFDSEAFFMTSVDFKNSWRRTQTTKIEDWTKDATGVDTVIENYISSKRSLYTIYQISRLTRPDGYANWQEYWSRVDGTSTCNILYIYGDTMSDSSAIDNVATWMLGDGKTKTFNGLDADLPETIHVDAKKGSELTTADFYKLADDGTVTSVKKYDYIFIAPDDYSPANDIKPEVRTVLNTLSEGTSKEGLTYIMFGSLQGKTEANTNTSGNSGSSSTVESLTFDTTTNFGKLLDLSVTTTGYSKKGNVLVVGTKFMDTLANNPAMNPTKVGKIVSLINKSTYRTHAGSGSGGGSGSVSTTAYRVLELQPCYPIDKELSASITRTSATSPFTNVRYDGTDVYGTKPLGNYYTIPSDVLNTSEIDNFVDENGKMSQEYYQWDLSKAKVAYALGMNADQIELVQMSTDEYITAKADVSDSYDLIYIGGNMSALKNSNTYGISPSYYALQSWQKEIAIFSMYTHTGEFCGVGGNNGQRLKNNNPYTYTRMNGNDITYDRLTQLRAYIDAGMPIVFSNEVWNAYEAAVKDGYKNLYMDPDCNMFKLCEYAELAKEKKPSSIITGWKIREAYTSNDSFFADYYVATGEEKVPNPDGVYGSAANVTVFNGDLSDELYNHVYGANTSVRPKFTIDTTALAYVEGDSSTELTERKVTWKVELLNPIEDHTYQAILLEDQDDNAVFETKGSERLDSAEFSGDTAELSYTYPSDDFGAFFWKILVVDTTTKASTGYSAITCFAKLEDQPKKQASILEIMPMTAAHCSSGNPTAPDGHTFYLDKNYQQSSGNPYLYSTYGTTEGDNYGYCPIIHSTTTYSTDELNFNSNNIAKATQSGNYQGLSDVNMGKYMTTLSVNRYDSGAGHEDRDYNYMDLVADEYDFSLDIMYMDDIEYYADAARKTTKEEREAYQVLADEAKELYDAYLTEGTPEYERLKVVEDALRDALISIRDGNGYSGTVTETDWSGKITEKTYTCQSSDYKTYGIDQMLQSRDYFRFFYLNTSVYHGSGWCQPAYVVYGGAYKPYIDEHDKMVDAYRKYRHYSMMAYGPKEYLRKNYDVIVVGFLDDYAGDFTDFSQNATDDLLAFTTYKETDESGKEVDDGGSLLMTHDNMTYSNVTSGHAVTLTKTMRNVMGMTAYSNLEEVAGTGTTGLAKYTTSNANRYFLTNLASDKYDLGMDSKLTGSEWDSTVSTWSSASVWGPLSASKKFGLLGYTDYFNVYETTNGPSLRYTYAEFQIEEAIKYNIQIGALNETGTAKATQVNRGVVTTYPFYIASDLRISNTHSQAFALDLEDKDVTVWYTLAADSSKSDLTNYKVMKENSSLYAATPRDGADNYYIYSVGNITYCGAGHALITGEDRDNNDERRLFLNVLINMAKKSRATQKEPEIVLYDPDGKTKAPGNIVKRDAENGYHIDVTSAVTYPEFGFNVENLVNQEVKDVKIFYDLDYKPGMEKPDVFVENSEDHILVPLPDLSDIITLLNSGEGVQIMNKLNYPGLVTKRQYFDKYGGKYTYLVISITLDDGTVLTRRIKIMLTKELLDLT